MGLGAREDWPAPGLRVLQHGRGPLALGSPSIPADADSGPEPSTQRSTTCGSPCTSHEDAT